jgi:hypothetical protein
LWQYTQIKIHNPNTNNLPFGDNLQEPYDGETILFHNINGFKDKTNWCKEPRKQQSNVSTGNDGNREQEIGRCRTMYLLESIASRQQEIERKEDVDNSQRSYKLDIDGSRYMRQRSRWWPECWRRSVDRTKTLMIVGGRYELTKLKTKERGNRI